jgi:hypothetical protein
MFAPRTNSIKKSSKIVGVPPEFPEVGGQQKKKTGSPSRKSNLGIKKPGR